jgi:hypothetical protein
MTLAGLNLIRCQHFDRQDGVADGKRTSSREGVPFSGVYKVVHSGQHSEARYVLALRGETVLGCLRCSDQVKFPLAFSAVHVVFDREELIVADLNLNEIDQEFMIFDASGHYSRPDVFTFETKSEHATRT